MSLLTGSSFTAAEVARELGLTHANASYHLRTLLTAGLIVPAGEERIRGGIAKRYRYDAAHDSAQGKRRGHRGDDYYRAAFSAVATELLRRAQGTHFPDPANLIVDADLWLEPEAWKQFKDRIGEAARELHDAAKPPRSRGTVRTSTSIAMFKMEPARTEPARTEPARTEPARTEPARTERARTERARTVPARIQPARTERARIRPDRMEQGL